MAEDLFYRRRLPHWQTEGAVYFVTWRLAQHRQELSSDERDAVVSALRHFDRERYLLNAFVIMNDHVHVMLKCLKRNSLEQILHSWKSFTANRLQRTHGRKGRVWQDESFDRVVRDEREFYEKISYIERNPFVRWPDLKRYEWVWVREGEE